MCGRYSLTNSKSKEIMERFGPVQIEFEFEPRYNITPSQQVPVVINQNGNKRLLMFHWGLIPHWARDESVAHKLINARAETLTEKPSFRESFEQRRCLVLADGFYEWKKEGRVKIPYRIIMRDGKPFAFAGLWDTWLSPAGQRLNSCVIITTGSNTLMETIHSRMPVILPKNMESIWLDSAYPIHKVKALLKPFPSEEMSAYEVSSLVNSPRKDEPACIYPVNRLF
ncbi:hypothetical protein Desor_2842 [Desulfosporosinus orientis DSM 765]|uniref:Abasic site processing protein n=1 Tax=Desulfosporosinus orientis (strain ATCC 19365 / DSM 765 / NCIMB 8382 / VKM B-1628 / Singapore I) TaxID=768706 RepID=G7WDP9_DESOD|nr:SOS response-associated peptidase [Desulfosporosinus orientis]AET68374.1 hypothetical protein Desor_2842 [Desulfosporosinus orientis DSM 765]